MIAVGLIVAYQAVTAYERLSPTDIALLFLFVFALALFVGLRFFVVDRYELSAGAEPDATPPVEHQATESGVEQTEGQESDTSPDEEERPA